MSYNAIRRLGMEIDKGFIKYTNTQWEALRLSPLKNGFGKKLWFLYQYCTINKKEPETLKKVESIKENNVTFEHYEPRRVRLGTGFSLYGWESAHYVKDINITDEQHEEIKKLYRSFRARKDSARVFEKTNTNGKVNANNKVK